MNHESQLNAIIGSDALRIDFLGDETDLIHTVDKSTTGQKSDSLNNAAFVTQMDTDSSISGAVTVSISQSNTTSATTTRPSTSQEVIADRVPKDKAEETGVDKELAGLTTRDVKSAQCELRQLDIHVCGGCHSVFHFVEEFNEHKNDNQCKQKPKFHANVAEKKPQIWGFLLWRSSQQKKTPSNGEIRTTPLESSWRLYQKWCKMPESLRNAWVAGGEKIMEITTSYMMPAKKVIAAAAVPLVEEDVVKGPVVMKKLVQRGEAGEIMKIQSHSETKKRFENAELLRKQLEEDASMDGSSKLVSSQEPPQPPQETLREEEFVVEKIVSRRYNPRKKQFEYLLKWEGYPPEQNTWEPAENLEACQHLLKAFEESLNKQALNKLNRTSNAPATTGVPTESSAYKSTASTQNSLARKYDANNRQATNNTGELNSFGRPVRYSKQKALNQVKAWCGSIKPDDAEIEAMRKRTLGDSETDDDADDPSKRFRIDRETDSEDSLSRSAKFGRGFGKRGPGRPSKGRGGALPNLDLDGVDGEKTLQFIQESKVQSGKSLTPASQQVLVASAKGVVQVDPSQVPNLSSGVYIMSNKSGIIKLDSVSPSKALSMKLSMVHDISKPAPITPQPPPQSTTVGGGGVITLNRQQQGLQKTGVVRRTTPLATETSHAMKMPPILPGAKPITRPSRPTGSIKINGPNPRPSTQSIVSQNKLGHILNTQAKTPQNVSKTSRSGLIKDDNRRFPGSITTEGSIKTGGKHGDETFLDIRLSSDSENGVDDFPTDLPPIQPASPPRPYSLCPKTGVVMLKAEGEKTPSPPQSPSIQIKEEPKEEKARNDNKVGRSAAILGQQKVGMGPRKESLVKKTLGTHGSVGSVTISPKKAESEAAAEFDDDEIVTITAEDGMVYKMSRTELNNSLLMAHEDGQQCVYVTAGENGEENAVLTLDPSSYSADAVSQLNQVNILGEGGAVATAGSTVVATAPTTGDEEEQQEVSSTQFYVKELSDDSGDNQSQLVAQVVEASEPAPGGGPRRVVLMLPDGNLMMTEMDEEQYAALELDKFQSPTGEIV